MIVSLPKGHGRTTCFQLPMVICQKKVSIVVVGVSSRIEVMAFAFDKKKFKC